MLRVRVFLQFSALAQFIVSRQCVVPITIPMKNSSLWDSPQRSWQFSRVPSLYPTPNPVRSTTAFFSPQTKTALLQHDLRQTPPFPGACSRRRPSCFPAHHLPLCRRDSPNSPFLPRPKFAPNGTCVDPVQSSASAFHPLVFS